MKRGVGIFLVGTFQGECILGISMYQFGFHHDIANLDYLAVVSVTLVAFAGVQGGKKLLVYANIGKQKQVKGVKGL